MAILPTRGYSDLAGNHLIEVKKGNKQALGEFVWQNQERFYAIGFIATGNAEEATDLTIQAFGHATQALSKLNAKDLHGPVWPWLSQFMVDACAGYHSRHAGKAKRNSQVNPSDGSSEINFDTQAHISSQRIKRCLTMLQEPERQSFILRQQLNLSYEQIATVLNKEIDEIMMDLFRSRVQLFKCLSQRVS